jgi:nucleotide-binding universal stress UspA family protein
MIRVSRMLCPVDFGSNAEEAFDMALSLAADFEAELLLVHVSEPAPALPFYSAEADDQAVEPVSHPIETDDELLPLLRRAKSRGVTADGRVLEGVPHREIVRCADEWRADMIVMGTMGRTGLVHALVGSTAERVVRKASCPVLTVRPTEATPKAEH